MFPVKPPKGGSRPRITTLFGVIGSWLIGWHTGLDFGWTRGVEHVRATYKGVIYAVVRGDRYYGTYVIVWHPDVGRWSWYCHLEAGSVPRSIKRGKRIGTGRRLGIMGETGNTKGRHLHYEERRGRNGYSANDIVKPILTTKRRPPWALRKAGWR